MSDAKTRAIKRVAAEAIKACGGVFTPARLDADRTAKPKTRLTGHARRGDCVGPGSVNADTHEDLETGAKVDLTRP